MRASPVDRQTGKVVWFNNAKGFGFLTRPDGPDVFVHFSAVQTDGYKSLKEGEEVEYSIAQGDKGLQAEDVIRTQGRSAAAQAMDAVKG